MYPWGLVLGFSSRVQYSRASSRAREYCSIRNLFKGSPFPQKTGETVAEKAIVKKKKKKFVQIVAPELFGSKLLGECPILETPQIVGRGITVNFMTLTGDMKKQHVNIGFKVVDVKEGKAHTEIVSYSMIPSLLKRFVRKGREKISDSFMVQTKDNRFVRIKPMLITNSSCNQSVVTNLRVTSRKLIQNLAHTYTYQQLVEEIMYYKLQKYVRDQLHKTYPLKICEIREFVALTKAPLNFTFEAEDIAKIVAKSRGAKKNKPEKEKKGQKDEDEDFDEDEEPKEEAKTPSEDASVEESPEQE